MAYRTPLLTEIVASAHLVEPHSIRSDALVRASSLLSQLGLTEVELSSVTQDEPTGQITPLVRIWSPDRSRLVQYTRNRLNFNHITTQGRGYAGWDSFRSSFGEIVRIFFRSDIGTPADPRWLELLTIDQLKAPAESGIESSAFLRFEGEFLPRTLAGPGRGKQIRWSDGVLPHDQEHRRIDMTVDRQGGSIVSRIVATHARLLDSLETLEPTMDKIHDRAIETFESLITDRTRTEIMGAQA